MNAFGARAMRDLESVAWGAASLVLGIGYDAFQLARHYWRKLTR